jgi:hypothetical protein
MSIFFIKIQFVCFYTFSVVHSAQLIVTEYEYLWYAFPWFQDQYEVAIFASAETLFFLIQILVG